MEIIGLVVIVILISLGLLFLATFALSGDSLRKNFTQKGLAASTMTSLMKLTTYDCGSPLSLEKEILDDCAQNHQFPEYARYCNWQKGSLYSCQYLEALLASQLNQTLSQWGYRYEYTSEMVDSGEVLVQFSSPRGNCPSTADRDTSGPFYLNSPAGLVRSVLFICN
jgi:hypothetical protein